MVSPLQIFFSMIKAKIDPLDVAPIVLYNKLAWPLACYNAGKYSIRNQTAEELERAMALWIEVSKLQCSWADDHLQDTWLHQRLFALHTQRSSFSMKEILAWHLGILGNFLNFFLAFPNHFLKVKLKVLENSHVKVGDNLDWKCLSGYWKNSIL